MSHIDYNNYVIVLLKLFVSYRRRRELLYCTLIINVKHVMNKVVNKVVWLHLSVIADETEIVQPFLLGCDTKSLRVVQISLTGLQRLINNEALSEVCIYQIVFSCQMVSYLSKHFTLKVTLSICFNTVMEFSFWIMILDVSKY